MCTEKKMVSAGAGCLSWRQLAAAFLRLPPPEASAYRAGTSGGPDGPSRAALKVCRPARRPDPARDLHALRESAERFVRGG